MSVWWLDEVSLDDAGSVGGKAANLGELRRAGFAVPAGFIIDGDEYQRALQLGGAYAEFQRLTAELNVASSEDRAVR